MQATVIKWAPDPVLMHICNAALNAERGYVRFSAAQKRELSKNSQAIARLTNEKMALPSKRRALVQKGGGIAAAILPIMSGVLSSLGHSIFSID